jgi:hypothetical protein
MKIRNIIILTAALCIAALGLSACHTDDSSGQGSVKINFNNSNARYAVSDTEKNAMIYTITLTSSGKDPVVKTTEKGAASVTISVPEGVWEIDVQAEGERILGSGQGSVTVITGKPASENIKMKITGMRVYNWEDLVNAFKDSTLKDLSSIEIVSDVTLDANDEIEDKLARNITIWAKNDVTIKRSSISNMNDKTVFTITNSKLILDGTKGGKITIEGRGSYDTSCIRALINVMGGGELTINNGVTITKNVSGGSGGYGGGVYVYTNGAFYMKGGIISNNHASSQGGGVFIEKNLTGGTFIKTGGIIYGSDAGINSNSAGIGPSSNGDAVFDKSLSKSENNTLYENDNWPQP